MIRKLWRKLRQQDRVEELEAAERSANSDYRGLLQEHGQLQLRAKELEQLAYSRVTMTVRDADGNVTHADGYQGSSWKQCYESLLEDCNALHRDKRRAETRWRMVKNALHMTDGEIDVAINALEGGGREEDALQGEEDAPPAAGPPRG